MSVIEPEFWERQWHEAIAESPVRKRELPSEGGKIDRWNKMAADFDRRVAGNRSIIRRRKTVLDLCAQGMLNKDSIVLDIGAGPGSWAFPLAEHSRHVTALEPADAMADILVSRSREQKVANIAINRNTWQSIDLDDLGWHKAYDLVFASMTPGVDGPPTLKKMMAASRGYCYLSTFAAPGMQSQYATLWEIFFNEPLGQTIYDIIYPFNLIYTMGYRPSLTFSDWEEDNAIGREEAVRMFTSFFANYMEMTPAAKSTIEDYIDKHTRDDKYMRPCNIRIGTMIWQTELERQV